MPDDPFTSQRLRVPYVARSIEHLLREALSDTRVVAIVGARQVGKSTLLERLVATTPRARSITLDDPAVLAAARADPVSLIRADALLAIDEVQRAPELLLAIKAEVDRDPRPGRYLLTGSAHLLTLPRLSDTLSGRMEILELWPFSQGEISGVRERFLDALLDGGSVEASGSWERDDYLACSTTGGFPPALERPEGRRRERWFGSYVRTFVQRDIRDLADIDRLDQLDRILRLVAARTSQLLNVEAFARDLQVSGKTASKYLTLLETTFLIRRTGAWSSNRTKRVVRAPKLWMTDSGLAAHLLGVDRRSLATPTSDAGPVVETFTVGEITKQATWADQRMSVSHLRTKDGIEVDVVLETPDGRVAAIEVKASAVVRDADFRGLRYLRTRLGERFRAGLVLYAGDRLLPFGDRLRAAPISALWETT